MYKNIDLSEVEECMLQALYGKEIRVKEEHKAKTLKKSNSNLGPSTPDVDLFYTPKCSPSEIQKPFCQAYCCSPIKRTDSDITCYYKIVSVDDIQIDEKTDNVPENVKDEEHLEKELAEQEELFLSFKSIFSKVNKAKPNSQQACYLAKKGHPKRKIQTNVISSDARAKAKLPLWRPNPIGINDRNNLLKKNCTVDSLSPRRKLEVHSASSLPEPRKLSSCSEMDVSTTGADSGLETSSSCQPEASPRENTVSETSGVDLTDAAINEEIPHDEEETESTKPAESIRSSSSSDVGTWDANDESRIRLNDKHFNSSVLEGLEERSEKITYDENGFCRDTLNEDEIARLDAMEKNIRECEAFLDRERQVFYCFDNNPVIDSDINCSLKRSLNSNQTISVFEPVKDVTLIDNDQIERANNNIPSGHAILNDYQKLANNAESEDSRVIDNCGNESVLDRAFIGENRNNEHSDSSYTGLDSNDPQEISGPEAFKLNSKEILQATTPPSSPRQICKPSVDSYSTRKSELIFPDVKSNSCIIPAVNNYFIDASSLLDEDEIISPPTSLINYKPTEREVEDIKHDVQDEGEVGILDQRLGNGDQEKILQIQEEERRQGDLIFKNSIPHFSRHEIQKADEAVERLESGLDTLTDDGEQVVPSADIEDLICRTEEEIRPLEECIAYSLPATLPSDFMAPKEEVIERELEYSSADGPVKRIDAESLPIVSGGLVPEDFSSTVFHVSSPHLRRRNESAPILSGGSDYVEEEKKKERKPSFNHGEAWVVNFTEDKPRRRRQTTATTSESDMESIEFNHESLENERHTGAVLKEVSLHDAQSTHAKETNSEEKISQRTSNPVEKSASLGYFIQFSKEDDSKQPEDEEGTNKKMNGKKNMFSMFIDMKSDGKKLDEKVVPGFERQNTYDKESEVVEEGVKKPFYMFIESDSPAVRRKLNQQPIPRKMLKSFEESADEVKNTDGRKRAMDKDPDEKVSKNFKDSSLSLLETSTGSGGSSEREPKSLQVRHSKLPLPLCKSNSLTSVNGDAKMIVWSEKKEQTTGKPPGETWLRTNDVQVTYKGRRDGSSDSDDFYVKKGSTFMIPEESTTSSMRKKLNSGFHLRIAKEEKGSFKLPEERDSGVIVTEESDDSFVKLSDMDNYKNPYLESGRKKTNANTMSQSIPENGWIENKALPKLGENENLMSRSSIGTGLVKSSSGTAFPSDINVSRSLSRLFPNLNLSNSFGKKSSGNVSSKLDTDPSDTQASEISEMSSMQSSVEPSALGK